VGETKTCNSSKNGHILHNEENIGKNLMNAVLNSQFHIEFTKIIGQFKQKKYL
jgi:hypothetical protein